MFMNPWGFGPYPYPQTVDKSALKLWKKFERQQETKLRKKEEEEKKKKPEKRERKATWTTLEAFSVLLLFSPLVGPLWLYAMISAYKHSLEMLSTFIK